MTKTSTPPSSTVAHQERITWLIWAGFILAAVALLLLGPERHPVNESYAFGARCWAAGTPLYVDGGCGFIYPPHAAIIHWPFLQLPHSLYEFAWRLVNLGLFAAGIYRLAKCCQRSRSDERPVNYAAALNGSTSPLSLFLLITLLTLPKTWTVALNGQATTSMAGLMMLAVADVAERRWGRAAAALLLAMAFKPLALVLLLLLAALYPPLVTRLAAGSLLFFGIPYLTQRADYVTAQYVAFVRNLDAANEIGQDMAWPNLYGLLHMFGIEVPVTGQLVVQIFGAFLTLWAAWLARRKSPAPQAAVLLYSVAVCYLLLLNPRTENNSYTMLMPAVAGFGARALTAEKKPSRLILLGVIVAAMTGGFELTRVVTPRATIVWPCPVACMAFVGFLMAEIARAPAWNRMRLPRETTVLMPSSGMPCSS